MKINSFYAAAMLPIVVWCNLFFSLDSRADVTVYTDAGAFAVDLAANGFLSQELDFESIVAGTVFPPPSTIDEITFENFGPPDLVVTNEFATTSGQNYQGMSSIEFADLFVGGYDIDMQFGSSNAIGFFVITGEIPGFSIFDNDIRLVVPGVGTALLDVDDLQATVGGTDSVFFVGLIDTMQTFTSAQVRYDASAIEAITFNIDDIIRATSEILLGDVNLDGFVNLLDVDPFVLLLSIGGFQAEADTNQDGVVNLLDVDSFVDLLAGGGE